MSQRQDLLGGQLPLASRNVDELGSQQSLGRTGFVDVDVGAIGAHHRPGGGEQGAESQHVRPRPVPHHQGGDVAIEQLVEVALGGRGPRVVAVGRRVSVVAVGQSLHDRRVHAGVVVAGEPVNGGGRNGHATSLAAFDDTRRLRGYRTSDGTVCGRISS